MMNDDEFGGSGPEGGRNRPRVAIAAWERGEAAIAEETFLHCFDLSTRKTDFAATQF